MWRQHSVRALGEQRGFQSVCGEGSVLNPPRNLGRSRDWGIPDHSPCSLHTYHALLIGSFPLIPVDTAVGALSLEFLPCHSRSQEMLCSS